MADMSEGVLATSPKKEKRTLRMGSSIKAHNREAIGRVGPFVRVEETGQICFLTASHLLTADMTEKSGHDVEIYIVDGPSPHVCGTTNRVRHSIEEPDVALVSTNPECVPQDISQSFRNRFDFHGVSALPFQEISKEDPSRMMKFVIFAEEVRMSEGKILPRGYPESDYLVKILLTTKRFAREGDTGAAVFAMDEKCILHCVGILIGQDSKESNAFALVNINACMRHFKEHHGYTLQMIESKFERDESITQTASSETLVPWDGAVLQRDSTEIESLLESGYLPNRKQLMIACQVFSMQSTIIENVTDKICKTILSTNPGKILKVWPGYRHGKENDIVFVVVTKEKNAEIPHAFDYDLEIRGQAEFTPENKNVIYEENKQDPIQDKNVMLDLQRCINKNLTGLTKEHSNLTIIASSLLKSKGYSKYGHEMIRKPCIVLYVHIKGIIPIKEKEFPRTLTSENSSTYDTDVREGNVDLHAGDWPYDIHTHVMMGCKIGGMETPNVSGTLGGFLEHPQYGLCALTCAHVLVEEDKEDKEYYWKDNTFICYQPNPENEEADERKRFGCLKYARKYSGDAESDPPKAGLDFALVKVDTNRQPVSGCFPRAKDEDWRNAGFERPMTFSSGNIFSFDQMYDSDRMGNKIIKFGAKTGVTTGMLALSGVSIPRYFLETIPIRNLIRVNNIKTEEDKDSFSRPGDSGSLVFMLDKHTPTAIGLLVSGSESLGCSFITPIHEILDDLNIKKLKTFK